MSTSSSAPAGTAGADALDAVEWVSEVRTAVAQLQVARATAAEEFERAWRSGPDEFDAQIALFESDASALAAFQRVLPEPPTAEPLGARYATFIDRTDDLKTDVDRIVIDLAESEVEIRSLLAKAVDPISLGHPAINEVIGGHPSRFVAWRAACFELQAELASIAAEPIDCIGVERSTAQNAAADVLDPSLIDISLTCTRGAALGELPYDNATYPWLAALPEDTSWIRSIVTITNHSEDPVQVQGDFRVRYDDAVGDKILEADWTENWPPAFHLQPGQTINRPGYAFDGLTFARPLRGEELSPEAVAAVFERLESCVIVGEPEAMTAGHDPFVDQEWLGRVELVDCGPNEETGRYEAVTRVTNPSADRVQVEVGFEILDAEGTRLGMGGTDGAIRVPAGGTAEGIGWSVLYTIVDVEKAASCRIVELDAGT